MSHNLNHDAAHLRNELARFAELSHKQRTGELSEEEFEALIMIEANWGWPKDQMPAPVTGKSPQLEALESIQQLIQQENELAQTNIQLFAEEIRDLLTEGGEEAFMAMTLVACEFGAVHVEREKMEQQDAEAIPE